MDNNVLLQKLDDQSERLKKIEEALITVIRQDEKIINLQSQVTALWKKYDMVFGPDGTISKLQSKADAKNAMALQWTAIGMIVALITALKLWG